MSTEEAHSLYQALDWFTTHAEGTLTCVKMSSETGYPIRRECSTYEEAKHFYESRSGL